MKAIIINVGDELLNGHTVNTNASYLALKLHLLGVNVIKNIVIKDDEKEIIKMLEYSTQHASLIIVTGGLGPTSDDVTKNAICNFYKSNLTFNIDIWENVKKYFLNRQRNVPENNKSQAMVPENAIIFKNTIGTAPGFAIIRDKHTLIALPGVPFELKEIFEKYVSDFIESSYNITKYPSYTFIFSGISESELSEKLTSWENELNKKHIKLAYLPSPGIIKLKIVCTDNNNNNLIENFIRFIRKNLHEFLIYEQDLSISEILKIKMLEHKVTLSTAESCTGGYLAHLITSIAGSSEYYKGTIIAYSNEIKNKILNVSDNILKTYGAVSQETAEIMAKNSLLLFNSDYSIAITGIAGPTGQTLDKPIGTTWISIASSKGEILSRKFIFSSDRIRNIERSAIAGIVMLIKNFLN